MKIIHVAFLFLLANACNTTKNSSKKADDFHRDTITETAKDTSDEGLRDGNLRPLYHASTTIKNELVHTKIEARFDWAKAWMYGKTTITARPYFYATDSLILDAKGMTINSVTLAGNPLAYGYKDDILRIKLNKNYTRKENYTLVIDYIAKPNERKTSGSEAITDDRGLYFINPTGEDQHKMPQIWTQGETQSNSVWFPTVDSPNMKSTQETIITVEDKFVTLSNGKLISSKKNSDGTRTDHWKQDLPHSVYLFMMAIGEFKIVKDAYTKKDGTPVEVNYYVEPEWESSARAIFGETPKMIQFFSELLKVEFPWDKYHQIVVRDYVSGAMENTSASVFGEFVYKTEREQLDGNSQSIIAHELFHHWFGDLVTAESWSNLTINESFANYSQYLWDEFRHGKDQADKNAVDEADGYFSSAMEKGEHNLVWFDYKSREDMFDGHSYNKGGRILHMLRNYLGDEAFFEGLHVFLTKNAFKAVEFHQLRLAFEEVCGEDLNWFFNQWYLGKGTPVLAINHVLDTDKKKVQITVQQEQSLATSPLYKLPVEVAVYDDLGKTIVPITIERLKDTFDIPYVGTLKTIVVDQQEMLLGIVHEKGKTFENYKAQYELSTNYRSRLNALYQAADSTSPAQNDDVAALMVKAMNDKFWHIREVAVELASEVEPGINSAKILTKIKSLATEDSSSSVRAAALSVLGQKLAATEYETVLEKILSSDSSYKVIGAALTEMAVVNPKKAVTYANKYEDVVINDIQLGVGSIYANEGSEAHLAYFDKMVTKDYLKSYYQIYGFNFLLTYAVKQQPEFQEKVVVIMDKMLKNSSGPAKTYLPRYVEAYGKYVEQMIIQAEQEAQAFKSNKQPAYQDTAERKKDKLIQLLGKVNDLKNNFQENK